MRTALDNGGLAFTKLITCISLRHLNVVVIIVSTVSILLISLNSL